MSELRRLLDGDGDELERALLSAAKDPIDDAERQARTLAALGLAGLPGPGAPGNGGGGGGGVPAAGAGKAIAGAGYAKWLAVAAVGAAVASGVALNHRQKSVVPSPARSVAGLEAPSAFVPAAPPSVSEEQARTITPEASAMPIPIVRPARSSLPPAASVTAKPADASALKREIQALDRARATLASGDTAGAKRELERYRREFPAGALEPEAAALGERIRKKETGVQNP